MEVNSNVYDICFCVLLLFFSFCWNGWIWTALSAAGEYLKLYHRKTNISKYTFDCVCVCERTRARLCLSASIFVCISDRRQDFTDGLNKIENAFSTNRLLFHSSIIIMYHILFLPGRCLFKHYQPQPPRGAYQKSAERLQHWSGDAQWWSFSRCHPKQKCFVAVVVVNKARDSQSVNDRQTDRNDHTVCLSDKCSYLACSFVFFQLKKTEEKTAQRKQMSAVGLDGAGAASLTACTVSNITLWESSPLLISQI